jgi:hypothetical protein
MFTFVFATSVWYLSWGSKLNFAVAGNLRIVVVVVVVVCLPTGLHLDRRILCLFNFQINDVNQNWWKKVDPCDKSPPFQRQKKKHDCLLWSWRGSWQYRLSYGAYMFCTIHILQIYPLFYNRWNKATLARRTVTTKKLKNVNSFNFRLNKINCLL